MNDYNKLRKSIKSILSEQELTANTEDERKPIMSFVEDDPEENQVQDDISQEELYDLLYNRGFKVGFVEYKSLMHLLCVFKVYGQNNSLPQVLQDFIQKVKDLEDNVFNQSQLAASHNIRNKNRLLEAASEDKLEAILYKIRKYIFTNSDAVENPTREPESLQNVIKSINREISKGLGWFVEVLFFTYCKENCGDRKGLFDWFDLELLKLKTQKGFYNATIDYAVSYFLIYQYRSEESMQNTADYIRNEIIDKARWNHRDEDVNTLARKHIGEDSGCSKALKDAQDLLRAIAFKTTTEKISMDKRYNPIKRVKQYYTADSDSYRKGKSSPDNKWVPGQITFDGSPHPEYDLWLIRKEDEGIYNSREDDVSTLALIDIKSYALDSEIIYPTKIAHKHFKALYKECNYFGFINFERSCSPFKEDRSMSEFKIDCKFFILHEDKVENHLSKEGDAKCDPGAILFNSSNGFKQNTLDDLKDEGGTIDIEKINHEDFYKTPIEEVEPNIAAYDGEVDTAANNSSSPQKRRHHMSGEHAWNNKYFEIRNIKPAAARTNRNRLKKDIKIYIKKIIKSDKIPLRKLCELIIEFIDDKQRLVILAKGEYNSDIFERMMNDFYKEFHYKYHNSGNYSDAKKREIRRLGGKEKFYCTSPGEPLAEFYKQYIEAKEKLIEEEEEALNQSHNIKGSVISERLLRSVIRNILREGDKKKRYSGSHPEESYGWSAKEEDFMFDKPGITTWEEDRQWVKEYLKSMGLLAKK